MASCRRVPVGDLRDLVSLLIERLPLWLPARFDSPVWAVSLGYEDQAVWEPLVQTETVAEYSRRCAAYPPEQPVFNLAFAATLDSGFHAPPLDDEATLIEIADSLEEDAERARDMWIEIAQHFNAHLIDSASSGLISLWCTPPTLTAIRCWRTTSERASRAS